MKKNNGLFVYLQLLCFMQNANAQTGTFAFPNAQARA